MLELWLQLGLGTGNRPCLNPHLEWGRKELFSEKFLIWLVVRGFGLSQPEPMIKDLVKFSFGKREKA